MIILVTDATRCKTLQCDEVNPSGKEYPLDRRSHSTPLILKKAVVQTLE
jgi:hypothetical protein